ncbi:hypothetical protein WJX81_008623 [Elliptochloris bilobata]|uniref:Uncharacterized protein n=1 Tax=Elliptochloris bilobata TaxID=381761 RepID=A0AAW1SKN5_9CHLO
MVVQLEDTVDSEEAESELEGIVGVYSFSEEEKDTFRSLVSNMRATAIGLLAAAGVNVLFLIIKQWLDGTVLPDGHWVLQGVALTRLSSVLNALVMAGLVWAGALSFKRVVRSDSAQLVYCMQGITQLGLIFMQMGAVSFSNAIVDLLTLNPIMPCARQGITQLGLIFMQMGAVSFSVAIVDLLTAAVRWPGVALVVAVGVAAVSVVRMLALAVLVTRYRPGSAGAAKALLAMRDGWSALRSFSRLERGAMAVVGASLLPYSPMHRPAGKLLDDQSEELAEGEAADDGGTASHDRAGLAQGRRRREYEFTRWEERIMEVVMEAMRMAGLALGLQALSSVALGIVELRGMDVGSAFGMFAGDLVDRSVRASLLFSSALCFQRVTTERGHDIANLLEGLGAKRGLSLMFLRMKKLTYGITMFKAAELVALVIGHTHAWAALCAWWQHSAVPAATSAFKSASPRLHSLMQGAGVALS